jgi:hypothetical protein
MLRSVLESLGDGFDFVARLRTAVRSHRSSYLVVFSRRLLESKGFLPIRHSQMSVLVSNSCGAA